MFAEHFVRWKTPYGPDFAGFQLSSRFCSLAQNSHRTTMAAVATHSAVPPPKVNPSHLFPQGTQDVSFLSLSANLFSDSISGFVLCQS
jgi:hypothetical protein